MSVDDGRVLVFSALYDYPEDDSEGQEFICLQCLQKRVREYVLERSDDTDQAPGVDLGKVTIALDTEYEPVFCAQCDKPGVANLYPPLPDEDESETLPEDESEN